MHTRLYKVAYSMALAVGPRSEGITKKAFLQSVKNFWSIVHDGGKTLFAWELVPTLAIASLLGVGAGYGLNRLGRHADPAIADSDSKEDVRRAERIKRIKYYKDLKNQHKFDGLIDEDQEDPEVANEF